MTTHENFPGLLLHTNEELSEALGSAVTGRQAIHEWPLSCVQELQLADGRALIYKSQLPPIVEPLFYQSASSSLLPSFKYLGKYGSCETMIIEKINDPLLSSLSPGSNELIMHGRKLLSAISAIKNVPVHLDLGSAGKWHETVMTVFKKLDRLIRRRQFRLLEYEVVDKLRDRALADTSYISAHIGLAHGDLKADQIFYSASGGYKVIDWQRPVIAPPETDLVSLLVTEKIDPRPYVQAAAVRTFWFLRLHWAVQAQFELFPEKRWPILDLWASEAVKQIELYL